MELECVFDVFFGIGSKGYFSVGALSPFASLGWNTASKFAKERFFIVGIQVRFRLMFFEK